MNTLLAAMHHPRQFDAGPDDFMLLLLLSCCSPRLHTAIKLLMLLPVCSARRRTYKRIPLLRQLSSTLAASQLWTGAPLRLRAPRSGPARPSAALGDGCCPHPYCCQPPATSRVLPLAQLAGPGRRPGAHPARPASCCHSRPRTAASACIRLTRFLRTAGRRGSEPAGPETSTQPHGQSYNMRQGAKGRQHLIEEREALQREHT